MLNSRQFATTLANGLNVLQSFRSGEPALTNKELVRRTGMSKATISRLTYTLVLKGLLTYDDESRRYRLGAGILLLGYPLLAGTMLRQVARPFMQQLAYESGGSVSLATYHRGYMVYMETCRGHDVVAFRPDIGARLPLLISAVGRAWLAQADDAERDQILAELNQASSQAEGRVHDIERFADIWQARRDEYARHGYCVTQGEWLSDVHAVAVPWHRRVEGEVLVFNCGVPTARLSGRTIAEFGSKLIDMTAQIKAVCDREG